MPATHTQKNYPQHTTHTNIQHTPNTPHTNIQHTTPPIHHTKLHIVIVAAAKTHAQLLIYFFFGQLTFNGQQTKFVQRSDIWI